MTTSQEVTEYAETQWRGYTDNGGSAVWKKYAPNNYDPASYCGAGQGMLAKHFDLPCKPTTHQRVIFVPYVVEDAREAGNWIYSKDSKPGDWVIFCWSGGYHDQPANQADHIGMIIYNDPAQSYVTTFEFNTTDPEGRMPRGAFQRVRSRSVIMGCVSRQDVYTKGGSEPIKPPAKGALVVDGWAGTATAKALQKALGTTADGVISGQPVSVKPYIWAVPSATFKRSNAQGSRCIAALQKALGVKADGLAGPHTVTALQKKLGVKADSYCGHDTVRALQRFLNSGKKF